MNIHDLHICRHEGRVAFRRHGVNGATRHAYEAASLQRQAFLDGHEQARVNAAECAIHDAAAYHALSVRDNANDRTWANKLSLTS